MAPLFVAFDVYAYVFIMYIYIYMCIDTHVVGIRNQTKITVPHMEET